MPEIIISAAAIFVMALLYSSVGHGGGSGYLAAMALLGVAPQTMRPTALVLNLLVAGIATVQFTRAGYFSWRTFWPFALASVPLAFVGGRIHLPGTIYKQIVGAILLLAAVRLWYAARRLAQNEDAQPAQLPHLGIALTVGAVLGLIAGITGVGGGIFLSPLLLLMGWADVKRTAAVSAAFIWVNSAAGLAGQTASLAYLPMGWGWWAGAAVLGGALGAEVGRKYLTSVTLRRVLAVVLVIAGVKMVLQ